jgi:hypothetical protein
MWIVHPKSTGRLPSPVSEGDVFTCVFSWPDGMVTRSSEKVPVIRCRLPGIGTSQAVQQDYYVERCPQTHRPLMEDAF